jgi:uncharacterized protein YjlB
MVTLAPLTTLRVSKHLIPKHALIPNTSIQSKPLLIYHSCFQPSSLSASSIEHHLSSVGVVQPQWRYTMYSTTHFHTTTHEVLAVSSGKAELCFGGEENPQRVMVQVQVGDVIIVPAGVGHRLMQDIEGGFEMVGSYPVGSKHWDMCFGKESEKEKIQEIANLAWFKHDPIYGGKDPCGAE